MVNFQELIANLKDRGWDYPRIAQKCGCSRSTIYMLANGSNQEPRYALGKNLVEFEQRTRPRNKS